MQCAINGAKRLLRYLVKFNLLEAWKEVLEASHHEQLAVPDMWLSVVWPHPQLAHHRVQTPFPCLAHLAPYKCCKNCFRRQKVHSSCNEAAITGIDAGIHTFPGLSAAGYLACAP